MKPYQSVALALLLGGVMGLLAWLAQSRILSKTRTEQQIEMALRSFLSMPQMQLQAQECLHVEIPETAKRSASFLIFPDLPGVKVKEIDGIVEVSGMQFSLLISPLKDDFAIEGPFDSYVDSVKNLPSPARMHEEAIGLKAKEAVLQKASFKFAVVADAEQVFYGASPSSGAIVSYRDDSTLKVFWWPDRKASRCVILPGTLSDPAAVHQVFHFLLNASFR